MRTVIGLFDDRNEAMHAYGALLREGFARADLDILTSDDRDDEPKLAHMREWVPEPDATTYLEGIRHGGTVVTANTADTAVARAAEIMSGYRMVSIRERAADLQEKRSDLRLGDPDER